MLSVVLLNVVALNSLISYTQHNHRKVNLDNHRVSLCWVSHFLTVMQSIVVLYSDEKAYFAAAVIYKRKTFL